MKFEGSAGLTLRISAQDIGGTISKEGSPSEWGLSQPPFSRWPFLADCPCNVLNGLRRSLDPSPLGIRSQFASPLAPLESASMIRPLDFIRSFCLPGNSALSSVFAELAAFNFSGGPFPPCFGIRCFAVCLDFVMTCDPMTSPPATDASSPNCISYQTICFELIPENDATHAQ